MLKIEINFDTILVEIFIIFPFQKKKGIAMLQMAQQRPASTILFFPFCRASVRQLTNHGPRRIGISSSPFAMRIHGGGKHKRILSNTRLRLENRRGFAVYGTTKSPATSASPAKNLPETFRNVTLYSDGRVYKLLRFPRYSIDFALEIWTQSNKQSSPSIETSLSPAPPPFGCFLIDKDEITMMVEENLYRECSEEKQIDCSSEDSNRTVVDNGINYRLFTFDDVVMDPSLVGFMAAVTKVLAESDISVLPYAAYSTDHLFVSESDADKTKTILEGLFQ